MTLLGSSAVFDSTVDGAHNLAITGQADFGGTVGGGTPLSSISVSGAAAFDNGITVSTTGNQTYSGAVTLDSAGGITTYTFNSTSGTVDFGSTVDGETAGEEELAVGGAAEFDGTVGGNVPLGSLSITGTTLLTVRRSPPHRPTATPATRLTPAPSRSRVEASP